MRLRSILFAPIIVGSAALASEHVSIKKQTEQAYVEAVSVGSSEKECRQEIGLEPALALVRYCRDISSATHPPCNTGNSCELIVQHIDGMCRGSPGTSEHPLPCTEGLPEADWDRISKIEAM